MGSLHRAYSILDVKAFDAEQRTFSGIATSPRTDRMGDQIDSAGVKFKNPLPLLLYHDSKRPVGEVRFGKATPDGIPFQAQISKVDRPGVVQDRINEAIDSLAARPPLIKAVSIGFREMADPIYMPDTNGFRYPETEVLELSMVVIPANVDATIDMVKSLDVINISVDLDGPQIAELAVKPLLKAAAAIGKAVASGSSAGASASSRPTGRTDRPMKKSYADIIKEAEATRAAKSARIDELLKKTAEEGLLEMAEGEQEECDNLMDDLKKIDAQIVRYRAAEEREKAAAVEVKGNDPEESSLSRIPSNARITVRRNVEKGILFARYAMCIGASRGIPAEAMRLAKHYYKDDPGVVALVEKAAVAGGATTGSHYLDDMVPYNVMNDFIEYLRPGSIIGKFGGPNPGGGPNYPSLNRVGFNERVSGMSTGYTAAWRGEGLPAIPSAAVTFNTSLLFHNLAALAILTKEAIRFSNPSAEMRVRDDLARAVNYKMDYDFVDPSKAAVGTTSPASITNGVVATTPSGTNAAAVRKDLATMIANFATNNLDPADIVLIMSASMALQISMMVNTLGNNDFPDITMRGGSLRGFPVIVSETLTSVGSPSTQTIIAVKASDVYLADDGVVTVEASDQASIEMQDSSSQSAISGTGASLVSLWQTGAVGLMALREITWKMRRATAVQYISPAAYST